MKINRNAISYNLMTIIRRIISLDTSTADIDALNEQIKTIQEKRVKLLDVYMSGVISMEEFTEARAKCDAEIEELRSTVNAVSQQRIMAKQEDSVLIQISKTMNEILNGLEEEDVFYQNILDKVVIVDKEHVEVYLNLLTFRWAFSVKKASKCMFLELDNISDASVPGVFKIEFGKYFCLSSKKVYKYT